MGYRISIIIPVYNDPGGLRQTIQSLIGLDYPKENYEIIIVDNGSTDNTFSAAKSFEKERGGFIKAEAEKSIKNSYAARNKGITLAKGEILCFIDADMWVGKDYLSRVDKYFDSGDVDYLGCNVELVMKNTNIFAVYDTMIGFPIKESILSNHFTPTCCLSVRKEVIEKIGVFDPRFESGGDHEFGLRVYEAGLKQKYAQDIIVYHPARSSYVALAKKAKRVARGIAQLNFYHSQRFAGHYKKHFNIRNINILSPMKAIRIGKKIGVSLNLLNASGIFLIDTAMRLGRFFELIRESRRLKKN